MGIAVSFIDLFVATTPIKINRKKIRTIVDTRSTENFICESLVQELRLTTLSGSNTVPMESTSLSSQKSGYCLVNAEDERQK